MIVVPLTLHHNDFVGDTPYLGGAQLAIVYLSSYNCPSIHMGFSSALPRSRELDMFELCCELFY